MTKLLSMTVLMALSLATCMNANTIATPPTLECRVEPRPPLTAGGPVQIRFVLTNPSQKPLWFLNWNTPFEGWRGSIFTVTDPQGTEVPYSGPMMKRGDPGREEYVQIPPGGTVDATADLANVYGLNEPGRYLLRVTGQIVDMTTEASTVPRPREQHQAVPLLCGEVELVLTP